MFDLLADDELVTVGNWVHNVVQSIHPVFLILIAVALFTVFVVALAKKWMSVVLVIAIVIVVLTGLWVVAEPAMDNGLGLH